MCLILFGLDVSTDCTLILAANRDEFYNRPTRFMTFWEKSAHILAGRDLQAGGTWFGINKSGRFAALTNYRDLSRIKANAPSRGEIIPGLLDFKGSLESFLGRLCETGTQYSGFNLLAGEAPGSLFWYSNQTGQVFKVAAGIHALSNHLLDTPWPKVATGTQELKKLVEDENAQKNIAGDEAYFRILTNQSRPHDSRLPDTGVGLEWERILSSIFVSGNGYGTRSSTLMRIHRNGTVQVTERTYQADDPGQFADRKFTVIP